MTPYLASSSHRSSRAATLFSLLLVLGMMLVACGGSGNSTNTTTNRATTLRVLSAPGQTNPDLFNPFFNTNQGGDFGAQGLLYEELYFTNLYTGQTQPWLATQATYNNDLTQLTFAIRPGVKWNDGQALTSADVKFTFDLMAAHPALDQNGVLPLIKSVATPDSSTVVFTLVHPDSTALFRIGDQVFIVPQHIWANISGDPAKYANDKNPVGTGPYLLKSWSPDLITYTVNSNYWGTKPQVQTIQVPSIKDNTTAITDMIQGKLDWMGTGWNPDYDPLYTQKDPQHNLTWFAASNTVMLYLNLQKAPFNNLLVRKAISAAINRDQLPQGVAQYAKVANPTGVIIPTDSNWISSQYQNGSFESGQSKVDGYLTQAGFKKDIQFAKEVLKEHDAPGGAGQIVRGVHMRLHAGSHVDAPEHNVRGGRQIHQLPLELFIGDAIIADLRDKLPGKAITEGALERTIGARVKRGDRVLLRTDHNNSYDGGSDKWMKLSPYLTIGATEWLVEKGVVIVGYDFYHGNDEPGSPRVFHNSRTLSEHGIITMPYLKNLDRITSERFTLIALPLNIVGAEASPVRAVVLL